MHKKILILGANNFFIDIIKEAKKLNLRVIAIDKNKNSVAKKFADEFHNIDFSKTKEVIKLARQKKINGIITHQSDAGVYSVGYVNNNLKLKGPNFKISKICSKKSSMRKYFFGHIDQPNFFIAKNDKDIFNRINNFIFPCIVKPTQGSGSRGVYIIKSKQELNKLKKKIKSFKSNEFIVEEFIEGIEFGSQVLVINGKIKKIFTHNDIFLDNKIPVPIGHSFPSKIDKNKIGELKVNIEKIVKKLKIDNAALNLDFIIGNNKKIYLIEIGLRCGATCLPQLIRYHSGINWERLIVKMAMNLRIKKEELFQKYNRPVAGEILLSKRSFKLKNYFFPKKNKNIIKIELDKKPEFKVNKFQNGTDRFGYIITKGKKIDEAESICKKIKKKIRFN